MKEVYTDLPLSKVVLDSIDFLGFTFDAKGNRIVSLLIMGNMGLVDSHEAPFTQAFALKEERSNAGVRWSRSILQDVLRIK